MDAIKIDDEIRSLIPPLSDEERAQLLANIKADGGIKDPLVVWKCNNVMILLDGHHRYAISHELGIGYNFFPIDLPDRDSAIEWVIRHQFGRRNITAAQRAKLALRLKPIVALKAENRKKSGKTRNSDLTQTFAEGRDASTANSILAKTAGVSRETISKVEKVVAKATPALDAAMTAGKVSIDAAAAAADLPAEQQDKIASGEQTVQQAKADAATDALGRAVPDKLKPVWQAAIEIDGLIKQARSFKASLGRRLPTGQCEPSPGYAAFSRPHAKMREAIRDIEHYLVQGRPTLVCVRCNGDSCDNCHKLGYITRDGLKTHLKNAVHDKLMTQEAAAAAE